VNIGTLFAVSFQLARWTAIFGRPSPKMAPLGSATSHNEKLSPKPQRVIFAMPENRSAMGPKSLSAKQLWRGLQRREAWRESLSRTVIVIAANRHEGAGLLQSRRQYCPPASE
jgi:hypothetical protein